MVNKKTMSVHNSAHLFIVNTADVPLTYRSPSAPPVFFFFFSFRLSTKRIELTIGCSTVFSRTRRGEKATNQH